MCPSTLICKYLFVCPIYLCHIITGRIKLHQILLVLEFHPLLHIFTASSSFVRLVNEIFLYMVMKIIVSSIFWWVNFDGRLSALYSILVDNLLGKLLASSISSSRQAIRIDRNVTLRSIGVESDVFECSNRFPIPFRMYNSFLYVNQVVSKKGISLIFIKLWFCFGKGFSSQKI